MFPTFSSVSLPNPPHFEILGPCQGGNPSKGKIAKCGWQSQLNVKIGGNNKVLTVASTKTLLRNLPIFTLLALPNTYSELTLYQSSKMSSSHVYYRQQECGQTSVLITSSKLRTIVVMGQVWSPGMSHWAASFQHTGSKWVMIQAIGNTSLYLLFFSEIFWIKHKIPWHHLSVNLLFYVR